MKKIALFVLALVFLATPVFATQQSTINPLLPLANTPITSAPVRNNFGAAFNDINNLYSLYGGISSTPGGTAGELQLNNGSGGFAGLVPGANGTCLTSTGTGVVWAVCGNSPVVPGSFIVTQTQVILQTQSGVGIVTQQN